MAELTKIISFLDETLASPSFSDASLNGLQVEGSKEVSNVAVAVDVSLELVSHPDAKSADLLIVHHGLFWGKPLAIAGPHKRVIGSLFESNTSLYTSHLPLDAHAELGNNQCLAELLELCEVVSAGDYNGIKIGRLGLNKQKLSIENFDQKLSSLEGDFKPLILPFGPKTPERVMIVSGSAADMLYAHKSEKFDTFITGEPKQFAYHYAKEHGLNAIFAGHYSSETLGVKALGKLLEEKFSVKWKFVDIPTGI